MQATGKKKTAKPQSNTEGLSPAQALLLVGDVGLEKYRSGLQYIMEQKGLRMVLRAGSGFGNLSTLASIIEQQQQAAKNK